MVYSIEVFFPVGISGWERVALAVWQGRTLKEAITNFRMSDKQSERRLLMKPVFV